MARQADWFVAQDTFATELKNGSAVTVTKGSHWPASHEVVLKDGGRNHLFHPQDTGAPEPSEKSTPKAAAKPAGRAS